MKNIYFIISLIFMNIGWSQENATTIYLIRHAEKADSSADTDLSPAGQERAQKWAAYFADKHVDAVYATPYKRTRNTALPTAESSNVEVIEYDPASMDLAALLDENQDKSIIIVGHSNTIPKYINQLSGKNVYPDMKETEFGNLYIITKQGGIITYRLEKL